MSQPLSVVGQISSLCQHLGVCVIVPFYNNSRHLEGVLNSLKRFQTTIIAVSDGSTDGSERIAQRCGVEVVSYQPNRGKGYALRKGFEKALSLGFHYALTIDADGQHIPEESLALLKALEQHPGALIVGVRQMKGMSQSAAAKFANRFSNLWFAIQTLQRLPDTQSGFRVYPLKAISKMRFWGTRYEFEVEVLVKAAWKGILILGEPVAVIYPPREERVSFFRPLKDFMRISLMNFWLVIGAFFYGHWVVMRRRLSWRAIKTFLRRHVFSKEEPLWKKSASIGLGVCMGIVPIWGWQMVCAALLAHLLKLNKGLAVISSHISSPPMLPFIIWGSLEFGALLVPPHQRLKIQPDYLMADPWKSVVMGGLQYLYGSVAFGICAGMATFALALPLLYVIREFQRTRKLKIPPATPQ
ncbi:MAG: DUF2062 domain-containing protein [Flavobacteriales bacterium]|nr:DUF2062 domain-containing protein [Flavobacteriales bacterium]